MRKRVPRGQSIRTSVARTSHSASMPNVTTRARVSPRIHITFASSAFSTTEPPAGSAHAVHAFSSRVTSSVPRLRWCSLPIDVTTATSGRTTRE